MSRRLTSPKSGSIVQVYLRSTGLTVKMLVIGLLEGFIVCEYNDDEYIISKELAEVPYKFGEIVFMY